MYRFCLVMCPVPYYDLCCAITKYVLFYSISFHSILFYSILFYSILFYSILFYSILVSSVPSPPLSFLLLLLLLSSFPFDRVIRFCPTLGRDRRKCHYPSGKIIN